MREVGPSGERMKNWVVMNFSTVNWVLETETLTKVLISRSDK